MGRNMSEPYRNLHKRVVNGDHEDFASILQRGVVDVSRHVGAGTRRACGSGSSATGTDCRQRCTVVDLEAH
jgi:hypothetical protein